MPAYNIVQYPTLSPFSLTLPSQGMTLWRLPRELRDLVYDFLLDEADACTCPGVTTGVRISPAIPSNITLVSRRMRDEVQSSWTKLSKITIVGYEEFCVRVLTSLAHGHFIWKLVRNLRVDITNACSMSLTGWRESGSYGSRDNTQAQALLGMCLTMPRLENLQMQVTTSNTGQSSQGLDFCIVKNSGHPVQQESVFRAYDRWHRAVRTETRFSWLGTSDVVCNGTLVHFWKDKKLAPGVPLLSL